VLAVNYSGKESRRIKGKGDTNVVVGAVLLGVVAWCQSCHLVAVNLVAPSKPLHFLINLPGTHLIPPLME